MEFRPPKIKKNIFAKNPIFFDLLKNGIYVIGPSNFYSHTKFWIDTSFFGQVIAKKKTSKLMTSNFQTQFLAIIDHVAQNKGHH